MKERQLKIAIDLDDVLFDFVRPFLQWHNRHYGTELRFADIVFARLWEAWGGTREEAAERIPAFFREIDLMGYEPIPGSPQALRKLKTKYQCAVVSARDATAAPRSRAWIDKYFAGIFDEVALGISNPYEPSRPVTKSELCRQLGAEVLIDDQLSHAVECSRTGIHALLFGDYPWNQTERLPPNVVRVTSWEDACRVLLGETQLGM